MEVMLLGSEAPSDYNTFRHRTELFDLMMEDGQKFAEGFDFTCELKLPTIRQIALVTGGEIEGLFKFVQRGGHLWEGHVCLAPEVRGKIGLAAGKEAVAWFTRTYPQAVLIGIVPGCNRPAIYWLFALGFRICGKIKNGFVKHGRAYPLYTLEYVNEFSVRQ